METTPYSTQSGPSLTRLSALGAALLCAAAILFCGTAHTAAAAPIQSVPAASDRIVDTTLDTAPVELPNTVAARVSRATVLGHLPAATEIHGMSLVITPSPAQQAALEELAREQQDPSSPNYHQWLTPKQFGARFGLSDADLAKTESWLQSQGFTVDSVAPGRNHIAFSGTAAQVERAFGTTMQRYAHNGQEFYSNSSNIHLPAALAAVVSGIRNLSSYRLHPHAVRPQPLSRAGTTANYTDGQGAHFLSPWDFRQIYNLNTMVSSGLDGAGIKVAVAGQSSIDTAQIGFFQKLTGQTTKTPDLVLVPNTGVSAQFNGDESESELDVEYAGGTAPGDAIEFVYTGDSPNYGVLDAVIYAIQQKTAPIISLSYGGCEVGDGPYATQVFEPYLLQANVQGQTVVTASGDSDSAECDADTGTGSSAGVFTTAALGLTVSYPASSPNVTAVGGTQFTSNSTQYWSATNNSNAGSALGYVPETTWNETADFTGDVTGSGGGASGLFSKPSWQTGPGVPNDNHRDLPDVAFNASAYNFPYLYCSANTTNEQCTATSFSVGAGGTSFAAPNFAAMLAIVEQANKSTGLGNINPSLYSIANSTSYGVVFHDVTTGNNDEPCEIGTLDCTTGTFGFNAGTGYDQATGLGSIDGAALATALPTVTVKTSNIPTLSLYATPSTAATGTAFQVTANVSGSGSVATGTVTFTVDSGSPAPPVTLANGAATFTINSFSTAGTHTVTAVYSGDSTHASVSTRIEIMVSKPVTGTFTLTSTPATQTIPLGNSAAETITLTSTGGFADTVQFTAAIAPAPSTTETFCYSLANASVAAGGSASGQLTIYTSPAACAQPGIRAMKVLGSSSHASTLPGPGVPFRPILPAVAAAGLLCFGLRRRKGIAPVLVAVVLSFTAIGLSGCGSGKGSLTTSGTGSGSGGSSGGGGTTSNSTTFTITITGTSVSNATISANTKFNLVVTQ